MGTKWLGKHVYAYEEISSTNTEAKRLAEQGAEHGSVVTAEVQTAGRGRHGRSWVSPKGEGIWFSLLLKPDIRTDNASMLTLVAAMAVVKAIGRTTGLQPQIKWPNDIVLSGKKVCGILTEMSAQIDHVNYMVVGIGINVKTREFPKEIARTASSLEAELERRGAFAEDGTPARTTVSGPQLLEAVLEEFEHYYGLYMETMDMSRIMEEYNSFLANKDRQVRVLDPNGDYEGKALGINHRGELLVEHQGQIVCVNSGEVSVRGIYGYV